MRAVLAMTTPVQWSMKKWAPISRAGWMSGAGALVRVLGLSMRGSSGDLAPVEDVGDALGEITNTQG
jgi:hypothetical protein